MRTYKIDYFYYLENDPSSYIATCYINIDLFYPRIGDRKIKKILKDRKIFNDKYKIDYRKIKIANAIIRDLSSGEVEILKNKNIVTDSIITSYIITH